jgi:hypothetical protein
MKNVKLLVFLFLLFPSSAHAGHVYGTVRDSNGGPVQAAPVEIRCSGKTYPGQTDQYGSYAIFVNDSGKCTFAVTCDGQNLTSDIYSYGGPVKYDFDCSRVGGGIQLRRR